MPSRLGAAALPQPTGCQEQRGDAEEHEEPIRGPAIHRQATQGWAHDATGALHHDEHGVRVSEFIARI